MGARPYVPDLGRFLAVDPVKGGSANDYEYAAGDPVDNFELDGQFCLTGRSKNGSCRSILGPLARRARPSAGVGWGREPARKGAQGDNGHVTIARRARASRCGPGS